MSNRIKRYLKKLLCKEGEGRGKEKKMIVGAQPRIMGVLPGICQDVFFFLLLCDSGNLEGMK